jgi:hypothetical protein
VLGVSTALALPPQCDDICEWSSCEDSCAVGTRWTTCGQWSGIACLSVSAEPTDTTASVTSNETQRADADSNVCSEENPAAEQVITTEG